MILEVIKKSAKIIKGLINNADIIKEIRKIINVGRMPELIKYYTEVNYGYCIHYEWIKD